MAQTTITGAQVRDGGITDADVAAANKDGDAATPSMRTLGSSAGTACAGDDSRLSDSRAPSGSAGGDLTGSYPDPSLSAAKQAEIDAKLANQSAGSPVLLGRYSVGTGVYQELSAGDGVAIDSAGVLKSTIADNLLINGGGDIWQRQTPGTDASRTDGQYAADRWYVLTQTAAVNVKRITGDATAYAMRVTQPQASAQRIGLASFLEYKDTAGIGARAIQFQGKVRISNSQNLRVAILGWGGTADSPTKDVVLDWTNGTFSAGNFFLASSLNVSTLQIAAPTVDTWTEFQFSTGALGTNNNIGVFLWTEGTAAQDVTLDLAEAMLFVNTGDATSTVRKEWTARPIQQEIALCQRYYEKSFPIETIPDNSATSGLSPNYAGGAITVNDLFMRIEYKVPKRIADATITYFKPDGGTANDKGAYFNGSAFADFDSMTQGDKHESGFNVNGVDTSAFTFGRYMLSRVHWTADAEI